VQWVRDDFKNTQIGVPKETKHSMFLSTKFQIKNNIDA